MSRPAVYYARCFVVWLELHGLYHVGMSADNEVDASVFEKLGHIALKGVGQQSIFIAPVYGYDEDFGSGGEWRGCLRRWFSVDIVDYDVA